MTIDKRRLSFGAQDMFDNLGDDITMRLMFQSTLPRGERRLSDGSREFSFEVSIHAPAWGATAVIV